MTLKRKWKEEKERNKLFISDLFQTLTHQHFCIAMQKSRTQAAAPVTFNSLVPDF